MISSKVKNVPSISSVKKESPNTSSSKLTSNNQLASTANLSFTGNYSEMDAVNALLTMKSRSSSMPIVSNAQLNQIEDVNKKGRRKVRPPTKKLTPKSPSNYDENSNETHLDDEICKEDSLDLNSDSSDDHLAYDKRFSKLDAKFSKFSSPSKMSDTTSRHLVIKANDDDDDDDAEEDFNEEESVLKIDESVQDEPEDLSLRKNTIDDEKQHVKKRKLTNPNLNNALLELSKAAKHIEDNKNCIKKFSF